MSSPLRTQIRNHLAGVELDEAQLQRLLDLQQVSPRPRFRRLLPALAAACLIGIAVLVNVGLQHRDHSRVIAEEVVLNHLKQRPIEVHGATIDELQPFFGELDFRLATSSLPAVSTLEIAGGRYCSVRGVNAAQIRLGASAGGGSTLYQAPYVASVHGELPRIERGAAALEVKVRGLAVSLWVEKGVLFALVSE